MRKRIPLILLLIVWAAVAEAHVVVMPRESAPDAEQQYTVRVPTEGQVSTTTLELEVPVGLIVTNVASGEGFTFDVRKENDLIVAITWKKEIKPKERAEFAFTARNPSSGQLVWKAHQTFADGSMAHWVGERGTKQPASVTQLKEAESKQPEKSDHEGHKH
jgi:uncharacterized protein YcnI